MKMTTNLQYFQHNKHNLLASSKHFQRFDRLIAPIGSICLVLGAGAALAGSSQAATYAIPAGLLLHFANAFARWWQD
ncbi:hypothetical protein [Massilia glaciei]|uniref:Uncharacterized protein n=1 Tax=Massilia glaciei TaxID=1524097 RepID=A0A2U2HN61_9BURK|nr:hypothetical protein [Massilia glaciei]PWF48892.1 hypothetical protein C7C56_009230 [Massilia glaciei]